VCQGIDHYPEDMNVMVGIHIHRRVSHKIDEPLELGVEFRLHLRGVNST
jgi:hypothetical protein